MGEPYGCDEDSTSDANPRSGQWQARCRVATFSLLCVVVAVKMSIDIAVDWALLRHMHEESRAWDLSQRPL